MRFLWFVPAAPAPYAALLMAGLWLAVLTGCGSGASAPARPSLVNAPSERHEPLNRIATSSSSSSSGAASAVAAASPVEVAAKRAESVNVLPAGAMKPRLETRTSPAPHWRDPAEMTEITPEAALGAIAKSPGLSPEQRQKMLLRVPEGLKRMKELLETKGGPMAEQAKNESLFRVLPARSGAEKGTH